MGSREQKGAEATMQKFITKNPNVVHNIKDQLQNITVEEVATMMIVEPDRTYVTVEIDGNNFIGHMIAHVLKNNNCVYIISAKSSNKFNLEQKQKEIEDLQNWCIENFDIHEIRLETKLNIEVFKRQYGFKDYSIVLNKEF